MVMAPARRSLNKRHKAFQFPLPLHTLLLDTHCQHTGSSYAPYTPGYMVTLPASLHSHSGRQVHWATLVAGLSTVHSNTMPWLPKGYRYSVHRIIHCDLQLK